MPKKKSSPIMQKVTNLLKISICLAKLRRPIIARLKISLRNPRKLKRFKLLKHYNYGYIQEYEFSPSSTPPVRRYYHKSSLQKQSSCRRLDSIFLISRCLGVLRGEGEDENRPVFVSGLDAMLPSNEEALEKASWDDINGDNSSIDERAEEFIERFYEEMRLQRQESLMMKQFDALVDA